MSPGEVRYLKQLSVQHGRNQSSIMCALLLFTKVSPDTLELALDEYPSTSTPRHTED
jgi:hypothetical protein